jgi:hypothetical protein
MPLVSASFSRRVAENHFGSADAVAGAPYRQRLQPGRLFMTFLKTGAMTRQYREAEAVLFRGSGPFSDRRAASRGPHAGAGPCTGVSADARGPLNR